MAPGSVGGIEIDGELNYQAQQPGQHGPDADRGKHLSQAELKRPLLRGRKIQQRGGGDIIGGRHEGFSLRPGIQVRHFRGNRDSTATLTRDRLGLARHPGQRGLSHGNVVY